MDSVIRAEAWKSLTSWVVLGALLGVVAIASAWINRDVYDKATVDRKVTAVERMHDRDLKAQQRQLDHIEVQVDKLVDKLIEGQ